MEEQFERGKSSPMSHNDGNHSKTKISSALKRLENLEPENLVVKELEQIITTKNCTPQCSGTNCLETLNDNDKSIYKLQKMRISLPFELMKMIFYLCDAKTRCRISCISKRLAQELSYWVDVQHLYITRAPIEDGLDKTIVMHAYQVITNSVAVGVIQTAKVIPMLHNFRNVKTLLVESSTMRFLDRCNKIPPEEGFFSLLKKLETVKLCSIRDNLSIIYTLGDFLMLPNLRVLHIRESLATMDVPSINDICAPIEDLRICTHRMGIRQLLVICRALATTLRRLELLQTVIIPEGAATTENRNNAAMEVAKAMIEMDNLNHLTLARTFLKPSISDRIFALLKLCQSLSTITFEILSLTDIIDLANVYLPPSANRIIITESIRVGATWYPLNSGSMEFFDVFNDARISMLQDACRRVEREITLQFGRLRGFDLPTINFRVGLVQIVASKIPMLRTRTQKGDCRVFLWQGHILSRSEYLKMNKIDVSGIMGIILLI